MDRYCRSAPLLVLHQRSQVGAQGLAALAFGDPWGVSDQNATGIKQTQVEARFRNQ